MGSEVVVDDECQGRFATRVKNARLAQISPWFFRSVYLSRIKPKILNV